MMGMFMPVKSNIRNASLAFWALNLAMWQVAAGQSPVPLRPAAPPANAQLLPLPMVPSLEPRPAEGKGAGQQWQNVRPEAENAPTATFVDSVKGNDAALEVIVGQGRLLTTKRPIAGKDGEAVIAVGDPSVLEFEVLPNPRMIRLIGRRAGVTDLSFTAADGQSYNFEVHVVYDMKLLEAQLRQVFPEALLKLSQISDHVVIEGQARSPAQVSEILRTLQGLLGSNQSSGAGQSYSTNGFSRTAAPTTQKQPASGGGNQAYAPPAAGGGNTDPGPSSGANSNGARQFQIVNLIRVPGGQQVMLQVRIAELNRTGMREIGADIGATPGNGNVIGTSIGGANVSALGLLSPTGLTGSGAITNNATTTAFGIFPSGDFEIFLRALRSNSLLSILAEPNLVSMSGHEAKFLAGGQFPIPVPQGSGSSTTNTIEFKDFGVQVIFLPFVLDDDVIRLSVTPEVSSIDFALGTTLVSGGSPVPGLNTRRATTTVELRQGQTLAIAGLLQVSVDAQTKRIPGLGDLPYLGPLFSNTTHRRQEKELLVLVTPHLVSPMCRDEVPALPGSEVSDPDDWEFYLLNRIENRTGKAYRATTAWDDPQLYLMKMDKRTMCGPVGYSESP